MKRLYLFFCLLPFTVMGQQEDKTDPIEWLQKANIGLRKTYSGSSKEEQKPASVFFNRDTKNNVNFLTVDMGLKISEWDVFKNASFNDKTSLLFYPKVEYHKNTSEEDEKDALSAGVNMEFFPVPYKTPVTEGWNLAPWFQGSVDYKRDKVNDLNTMNYQLYFSLFSARPFLPGGNARANNGSLIFRYFVYSGYERYADTKGSLGESSYWSNRLFMELWPIPALSKEYLQLTFEYNYRLSLQDDLYQLGSVDWMSMGINVYPTGKSNLGIGLEYSQGNDPTNSFTDTGRLLIGLNIKI
ncbi:hypothetical protein [Echinicola vietnamensis]|uniref:DUF3078 domain-containing protein n=1 Tax=Echinicola vietnamensis (strain DSM 17526 / LMG 23754 / KMM 6221) TaxID=926556 RepID=L0FY14_ECHVK|nr:hypothetical protein [Echinicola vietnamensis]AGA78187.1 hypothetical protein Echvi_1933 [Echinicola vietnamensis DSM 17526]